MAAGASFVSHLLTPTGLSIERMPGPSLSLGFDNIRLTRYGDTLSGPFSMSAELPPGLPQGTYRLFLTIDLPPGLEDVGHTLGEFNSQGPSALLHHRGPTVGIVTIGAPQAPRLSAALLIDNPSQGQRGAIANEDRSRFALAARIVTQSDRLVIEPQDLGTGELIRYRLEPFFPLVSLADRNLPDEPPIPFDLPGGELTVNVVTPAGETQNLGTHEILQVRIGHAATSIGGLINDGGGNPGSVFQLTTLSNDFSYRFREYGRYRITLSGSLPDIWGTDYPFGGTFDIWVAETLDLEAASLPATPFEVGDRLPAVVNVFPGVPAQIEWAFELHPIDGSVVIQDGVSGTANRFGYFDGGGKTFDLGIAGEYLVTINASYTDRQGRLWMATRRWGSGVANRESPLIAHGRRGIDAQVSPRRAWYLRSSTGVPAPGAHMSFPYFSGDIVWNTDDDSVQMRITVDDREGTITGLIAARHGQSNDDNQGGIIRPFNERVSLGELPLMLSTSSGIDAATDPGAIDQLGYAYRAVERPGVRVRESVGVDHSKSPYWRFNDTYLLQHGMGAAGELPKDIKWQFGAAVFKRPDLGIGEVAIYASLWVEIDEDDPRGARVLPPFQGAAGGPTGGPIMTLKGQEIDLFLMPTAVRPGTILEVGDRFVFAGQVGPPLASKVTVQVTSPSGVAHTFSGQANLIGFFGDPARDFVVDEQGIWTVEVQVLHDGLTSAGPVEPPYPTGGVLGSADGRFQF